MTHRPPTMDDLEAERRLWTTTPPPPPDPDPPAAVAARRRALLHDTDGWTLRQPDPDQPE